MFFRVVGAVNKATLLGVPKTETDDNTVYSAEPIKLHICAALSCSTLFSEITHAREREGKDKIMQYVTNLQNRPSKTTFVSW